MRQDSDSGGVCRTGAGKEPELPTISGIFLDWLFKTPGGARLLLGKWKHDKPRCSKAWLSRWASVSTPLVPGFSGPGQSKHRALLESHNFPPVHILIHQRCPRGMGFLNPVDQKKKEQLKVFSSGKRTEAYTGGTDWCPAFALGSLEPGLEVSPALPQLHRAKLGGDPFQEHL